MAQVIAYADNLVEAEKRIKNNEQLLGKCLNQPFARANSGSRRILSGIQFEHTLNLMHPEVPIMQTGYEIRFGDRSSSIIEANSDYTVLRRIEKFSDMPGHHYFNIVHDTVNNVLDVIEKKSYKHNTEAYGYTINSSTLDNYKEGDTIYKGTILSKSLAFDDYNNRCDGVNLLTTYIACNKTMEDGIQVSESGAKKLASPLIKKPECMINDNDITLNLYGDDENYKSFPDIGEKINNGILLGVRRERIEESLFMQSKDRLKTTLMSDDKYTVNGTVIDIDIFCNSPDKLKDKYTNSQLYKYYEDKIRYTKEIVDTVDYYKSQGITILSNKLQKLYEDGRCELDGALYVYNDKVYSGTMIRFIILEESIPIKGDKISNRYGGKGVISDVVPDELMPILDDGRRVELVFNQSTCLNRLNRGQLIENSLTHIGKRILDYISMGVLTYEESFEMILKYIELCVPNQAHKLRESMKNCSADMIMNFVDSMVENGHIVLSIKPITESLSIDDVARIYDEFPWITQNKVLVPIEDSNGNYRYVQGRRSIVCGDMFIYRLKQYSKEKFSVTSLSSTNIRNENSRNKANKNYKALHQSTPIRFGDMESGDMTHMGIEIVMTMMMLYSSSPHGRLLIRKLYTDDPYDVDIKLDEDSTNRSAEIFNVYFKTMGLKIKFVKIPKNKVPKIMRQPVYYNDKPVINPVMYVNKEETGFDINEDNNRMLEIEQKSKNIPIIREPVYYDIDSNHDEELKRLKTNGKYSIKKLYK